MNYACSLRFDVVFSGWTMADSLPFGLLHAQWDNHYNWTIASKETKENR